MAIEVGALNFWTGWLLSHECRNSESLYRVKEPCKSYDDSLHREQSAVSDTAGRYMTGFRQVNHIVAWR